LTRRDRLDAGLIEVRLRTYTGSSPLFWARRPFRPSASPKHVAEDW